MTGWFEYPAEVRERAREMRAEGKTDREISQELGVSTTTLRSWGSRYSVDPGSPQYIQAEARRRARTVACSRCGALPKAPCIDSEGNVMTACHNARKERADQAGVSAGLSIDNTGSSVTVKNAADLGADERRRYGFGPDWTPSAGSV